ncbi:uncharacterized protein MYCFIDRAFT_84672 [Pseudocercospora fijiensis CIRAD86]|uniref:Uncharacterized protein n=1 Tax=Pseudocercospora fijiensis (strain CIRAD86) TaxID=383855 RepID=M3A7R8_PSEFD|nr:uncharacterized protein MYCFIDRAFT_84672 [Pseudocercospora fijiensis CIRAD86]EME80656.1 hypothetical protein MYCFIDRAFT_84672 [Pseudocercospora fijiensis CIRAD86]
MLPPPRLGDGKAVALLPQNWQEELEEFPPRRKYEPSYVDLAAPERVKIEIAILEVKIRDLQGREEYKNSKFHMSHWKWRARFLEPRRCGPLSIILQTTSMQTLEHWKHAAQLEVEKARDLEEDLSRRNAEESMSRKKFDAEYREIEGMKQMWKDIGRLVVRRLGELDMSKKK